MSFRTIVLIAASVIIGIAFIATVSTETSAATAPAGTKRLHHNYHHGIHHSGQVRHPQTPATTQGMSGATKGTTGAAKQ